MNLDDQLNKLSVDELAELYASLGDYHTAPVSIDEFITSPEFLGNYWAEDSMYEFWRRHLRAIYPSPVYSPYWLVSLRGGIGLGKTSIATTGMAYDLYRLLCLINPQKTFGLVPTTKIVFSIFNVTMSLASDVVWDQLQQMFGVSPYFSQLLGPLGTKKKGRDTLFPKRIDFTMGSRIGHSLGKAVYDVIIDEANFGILDGQVYENFNSLLRRIESRFTGHTEEGMKGKIWIVSSETDKSSVMNKIVDSYRGKEGVYVIQDSLWNVKPHKYGTERFKVYKGSEVQQPKIMLDENDKLFETEPQNIIDVPVEHRDSFETDIHLALRDLAGVSTTSSYKLFRLKDRVTRALVVSPLFPDEITLDFDDDNDLIEEKCLFKDYFKNPLHKHHPRNIHVDIALSGDRLGIASSYVAGFKDIVKKDPNLKDLVVQEPLINTEWCVGIRPTPGKQIPLFKIRMFIYWLAQQGYHIGRVTFDGFQSADSSQLLQKEGYVTEIISVDKTTTPYISLREKVYDGTWHGPNNPLLKEEFLDLEVSSDYKKVDHTEKGSKDCADAVCGSVYVSKIHAHDMKLMDSIDRLTVEEQPDNLKSLFNR